MPSYWALGIAAVRVNPDGIVVSPVPRSSFDATVNFHATALFVQFLETPHMPAATRAVYVSPGFRKTRSGNTPHVPSPM